MISLYDKCRDILKRKKEFDIESFYFEDIKEICKGYLRLKKQNAEMRETLSDISMRVDRTSGKQRKISREPLEKFEQANTIEDQLKQIDNASHFIEPKDAGDNVRQVTKALRVLLKANAFYSNRHNWEDEAMQVGWSCFEEKGIAAREARAKVEAILRGE